MSTIWTPSGEHEPEARSAPETGAESASQRGAGIDHGIEHGAEHDDDAAAEDLRRIRAEVAATPAVDLIANHAVGLWQLALLHLMPEDGTPPRLDDASLAIDAMGGIVDGLGARLDPHAEALRDALSQLRLVYVQVRDATAAPGEGTAEESSE